MSDFRAPVRDMAFVLDHLCGLPELARLPGFEHAEAQDVTDLLEEAGRFMAEVVAPLNRGGDSDGCVLHDDGTVTTPAGFADAYQAYVEAGWGTLAADETHGGGGFPWVAAVAVQEILSAANLSLSLCPMLTHGAIELLAEHGDDELKATYLPKLVTGEWTGTMVLTEADAGSDLGGVRARAVRGDDGTYRISGTKIFISFGEHDLAANIVHLVLARTPDAPAGTRGISCFVVPKYLPRPDGSPGERNDITCVSIEHKLGIKASPTCVLSFGDTGGATGFLVGEEHQGLHYMFTMMNNARLLVGVEGLAVAERAYQQALAYACARGQGRTAPHPGPSPIVEHPDVRRMLLTMKSSVEAMRRLVYWNATAVDWARHHPETSSREQAADLAALLTPLTKAWCTDVGTEVASLGIQVHGGVGYIEETGAAQYLRDARVTSIYEGTNGIQAIDLVTRKLPLRGGAVVKDHLARMAAFDGALKARPGFERMRTELAAAVDRCTEATTWLGAVEHQDRLAGATPYLRMLATVTAGWLMARSAVAAAAHLDGPDGAFFRAKVATARFFCEQLLPLTAGLMPAISGGAHPLFSIPTADLAS